MIIATAASTAAAAVRTAVQQRRHRHERDEAARQRAADLHRDYQRGITTAESFSAPFRRLLDTAADIEQEQLRLQCVCPPDLWGWAKIEVDRREQVYRELFVQLPRARAHPRLVALRSLTRDFTHGDI